MHAKLEIPMRIASGDVVWEAESMNLKLQGEVKAGVRNLEPSTNRWHLTHGSGCNFWPENADKVVSAWDMSTFRCRMHVA